MARTRSQQVAMGIVLAAAGAVLLAVNFTSVSRLPAWLLALGFALGLLGVVQRAYASLVAGCVLLGLGAGVVLGERGVGGIDRGNWLFLALGIAFLAIYLLGMLLGFGKRWWPLVPGLGLVAAAAARGGWPLGVHRTLLPPTAEHLVRTWWPAALVALGLWLVLRGVKR
jgi:hypothetical protein